MMDSLSSYKSGASPKKKDTSTKKPQKPVPKPDPKKKPDGGKKPTKDKKPKDKKHPKDRDYEYDWDHENRNEVHEGMNETYAHENMDCRNNLTNTTDREACKNHTTRVG